MQVRWSEPALEDMEGIQTYIGKDSSFYARQFIERIFEVTKKLEDFPELGRVVFEAGDRKEIRELIFQGYRIIYLHHINHIYIVTVIHGSRDLSGMDNMPWDLV